LTIEERQAVRKKIKEGYLKHCTSFEELLEAVTAIGEEELHASAPSRLDYFKSGFEYEARIKLKRRQLTGVFTPPSSENFGTDGGLLKKARVGAAEF
jgi:hypothetical protein